MAAMPVSSDKMAAMLEPFPIMAAIPEPPAVKDIMPESSSIMDTTSVFLVIVSAALEDYTILSSTICGNSCYCDGHLVYLGLALLFNGVSSRDRTNP